jgi:choline dehydrogenase
VDSGYDYIVVGGGSAGCVLASRLSADPAATVLLLESGGPDSDPNLTVPALWPMLMGTDADWSYETVPQVHAAGRRIGWPRGRVLGGSSSINAMVYMRGAAADFDRWAEDGCVGWDAASVLPAFKALEDYPGGDPATRGVDGPLKVRIPDTVSPFSEAVYEAALELGHQANDDFNSGSIDGVGWNQLTVADGSRQSSATAFLRPVRDRANLTVLTAAHAVRLAITASGRVTAVDYLLDGAPHRAQVAAEVILACGAIESPKLLMLSGIGPAEHLRGLGIEVTADLPGVGANLHDHPGVPVTFETGRPVPPGPNQASEVGLFCRSSPDRPVPDLQFGVLTVPLAVDATMAGHHGFTLYPSYVKPASRGTVRLRSADAADRPLIDPAYLREGSDVAALSQAVDISRELAATSSLREWAAVEKLPGAATSDRPALRDYAARAVNTWFHPVGTCRMGTNDDCVVDPWLRVVGTENLRVADASVMPEVTSGNTNAPTLMIAARAADLVASSSDRTTVSNDA